MRAYAALILLVFASPTLAAPGDILSSTPVAGAPDGAQAWRIVYQTNGENGEPTTSGAMIVAPAGPGRNRPVLAWDHGTWGVADKCQPSASPDFLANSPALEKMLARGYVVAATDYAGLGTPGPHGYMVGKRVAHSTLDAVRAARQIDGARAGRRYVVWGESEGGHAALFTGFNARRYAPELDLVAVTAAAPATDLLANLQQGKAAAVRALLTAFIVNSWADLYGANSATIVKPATRRLIDRLATNNCISLDAKPRFGTVIGILALQQQMKRVDIASAQPWARLARRNSAPVRAPDAPLMITQSREDQVVAPAVTLAYARKMCRSGQTIRYVERATGKHEFSARDTADMTLDWFADRLNGKPFAGNCGKF